LDALNIVCKIKIYIIDKDYQKLIVNTI
jgi:hypothetical protein